MTFAEWDKEAASMTGKDLKRQIRAINTLDKWKTFKGAYGWTGYKVVATILQNELDKRERAYQKAIAKIICVNNDPHFGG